MRNVFERSANRNNGNNVTNCNTSGNLNNNNANNGNYCAPDCVAKTVNESAPLGKQTATQSKESSPRAEMRDQLGRVDAFSARASNAVDAPTFDDAFDLEPLLESTRKCLSGVTWKGSGAYTYLHAAEIASALYDELHGGTYQQKPACEFPITKPKPRIISSIHIRDRIVQRSLNDNVIYPIMSRSWIYDNYACQKGKGTDFGRARMRRHFERFVRENGPCGFHMKVDVLGYYAHMVHAITNARFAEKLPEWASEFVILALSSQYSGAVGYKPGSQLVQIAGIDYLDKLDHHIKERMRVRYYGRYMDDLVMLSTDRDELVFILSEIERELALIGMETHKKKTRIEPLEKPLTFLGFDYRIRDGCVSMLVTPKKVKEQRRSLRTLSRLVAKGRLSRDDYLASLECMVAHLSKGDSKTLPDRMNAYGHELIGDYIGC